MSFWLVLQGKLFRGICNVSLTLLVEESGFSFPQGFTLNNSLAERIPTNSTEFHFKDKANRNLSTLWYNAVPHLAAQLAQVFVPLRFT